MPKLFLYFLFSCLMEFLSSLISRTEQLQDVGMVPGSGCSHSSYQRIEPRLQRWLMSADAPQGSLWPRFSHFLAKHRHTHTHTHLKNSKSGIAFRTILLSTQYWKHSAEVLVHILMTMKKSCSGSVSCSFTFQKCSFGQ